MWLDAEGTVTVAATTSREGAATFIFTVTAESPPKIRSMRVTVGG